MRRVKRHAQLRAPRRVAGAVHPRCSGRVERLALRLGVALLVISPHLDDGVLSCAELIAAHRDALVATVMAGRPDPYPRPLPEWDVQSRFQAGDDVVGVRRAEDIAALAVIGARCAWLDFLDQQYAPAARPSFRDIASALGELVRSSACDVVASPLGIVHPDHLLTAAACFELARQLPAIAWIVYADTPYKTAHRAQVDARLAAVRADGFVITDCEPARMHGDPRKHAAIECYATQLNAPMNWNDALLPERYWALAPR
jgi:LmbE family N-acetylglucosaminyl deacetylase